jgi:cell division protein FtsL
MDRPVNEPQPGFTQQLAEFFRRNTVWFLAAAFALLLMQDVFGTHGVLAMRRAQQEAKSVRAEIDQLNQENSQLQENVKSLRTDPAAIERIAREEMGLARPGEYIFRLSPKFSATPAAPSTPADPAKQP